MAALAQLRDIELDIVAQIIETEFAVGAVGDIGFVGFPARAGAKTREKDFERSFLIAGRIIGRMSGIVEIRSVLIDNADRKPELGIDFVPSRRRHDALDNR